MEQGAEVIVEKDQRPVVVMQPAPRPGRLLSECIAAAAQRERERGYAVTLDPDFAADVEKIVNNRRPWNPPPWD